MGKAKAANDMPNNVTPITAAKGEAEPAVIVFGKDESGKPHASWFSAAEAELAEKAAGYMRFKVLRVTSPDIRAKALELAAGRVFASGRGFVPFTKMAAYEALEAFGGAIEPPVPPDPEAEAPPIVSGTPQRWEDIAAGSQVLASAGDGEGWFEAVVVEVKPEDLLVLKWRDWPEHDAFVRRPNGLGLLPLVATGQSAA